MVTMTQLSPTRRFFALFTLALGGFGIGVTEFASMGLLPDIARDLLPGFDAAPERVIADAGVIISAYALGVVVGAPTLAVFGARLSQTKLTIWLLIAFTVTNLSSALMPDFQTTAISRFVSGIPHGAYFGVAALLAGRIMGPGKQGRGVALTLSGLTIANVIGVPLATWLGQTYGWRSAYVAVSVIFGVALLLGLLTLPPVPGDPTRTFRGELRAFKRPQLWLMMGVGAIGFGGFFAIYSYLAEVTTRVTGLAESSVPWVLAVLGLGMTVGNFLGGWAADRSIIRTSVSGMVIMVVSMIIYTLVAQEAAGLFVTAFLVGGTGSFIIPAVQTRLIRVAGEAELLGSALNHAAFNVGNAIGPWVGGLVIAGGYGYLAPGWAAAGLATLGLILLLISFAVERYGRHTQGVAAA